MARESADNLVRDPVEDANRGVLAPADIKLFATIRGSREQRGDCMIVLEGDQVHVARGNTKFAETSCLVSSNNTKGIWSIFRWWKDANTAHSLAVGYERLREFPISLHCPAFLVLF